MVLQPNPRDYSRIRSSLKWYKVASIVTGVMLLLLLAEMILKYSPTHVELFAGGDRGFLSLAPVVVGEGCQWFSLFNPFQEACEMTSTGTGVNLSLMILIIHGWFYVAYLIACFMVWSPMRWRFGRFLKLALGGVIPLLSFFMEVRVVREVSAFLDTHEKPQDDTSANASAGNESATAKGHE